MSLLTVCQDVADVIGLTPPTAIITGQDQLSRQMRGLAKKTVEELGLMDWPVLEVPYSFNTVVNQSQYAMPLDFGREVGDTVYTNNRYFQVRGQLTAADWARQRNTLPQLGAYKFRIFGNPVMLVMTPTPTTVDNVVLEYQTTNRVSSGDGTTMKTTYSSDDDVSLMPEELVKKGIEWRLRRAKGLDYSEEFDDYELSRFQRLGQQVQPGSIPVSGRSTYYGAELGNPYCPETGFGA